MDPLLFQRLRNSDENIFIKFECNLSATRQIANLNRLAVIVNDREWMHRRQIAPKQDKSDDFQILYA